MNYPNGPVCESRSRRVGSLSAFRATLILAAVVLTAPFATADVNPIDNIHPTGGGPGPSSTDSPEIAALKKKIADLQRQLAPLTAQRRALRDQEPQDPGPNASGDAKRKYQIAHASWQQQVDKLGQQIFTLSTQLSLAERQLQALQTKAGQGGH